MNNIGVIKMKKFKEGQKKLQDLTKLKEFRDEIKRTHILSVYSDHDHPEHVFTNYYVVFSNFANRIGPFFKDKSFEKLLKEAGVSQKIIEELIFWSKFADKLFDSKYFFNNVSIAGRKLKEFVDIAASPLSDKAKMDLFKTITSHKFKKAEDLADMTAELTELAFEDLRKKIEQVEKSLTGHLKTQKMPKTSVLDVFRKEKAFEK